MAKEAKVPAGYRHKGFSGASSSACWRKRGGRMEIIAEKKPSLEMFIQDKHWAWDLGSDPG